MCAQITQMSLTDRHFTAEYYQPVSVKEMACNASFISAIHTQTVVLSKGNKLYLIKLTPNKMKINGNSQE